MTNSTMIRCLWIGLLLTATSTLSGKTMDAAMGPLRISAENPRYFARPDGKAVLLTGSHTWSVLQNMGREDPPHAFNFDSYLNWMRKYNHNFIRGWRFEFNRMEPDAQPYTFWVSPQPWIRSGPDLASDGKPTYNLKSFDPVYFKMLRSRLLAAKKRGIYMSVMFFCGWGTSMELIGWKSHPFNAANNINGINGDPNGNGLGGETHTLAIPEVTRIQEAYIRKVIDAVNDLDNVLYEVANETPAVIESHSSTEWQYHIIRFIKEYEKRKPKQHPVGMTYQYSSRYMNPALFASPADWISPNPDGGYKDNPPASDGKKVIINDTDHLWGIGGNYRWVWMSFMRGMNPIFMDPYDGVVIEKAFDPQWEPIRRNMGYVLRYSKRVDMNRMTPHSELASSGLCLADPGREYIVYLPDGKPVTLDLSSLQGSTSVEWFNPETGKTRYGASVPGGGKNTFQSPFGKTDAVLFLKLVR